MHLWSEFLVITLVACTLLHTLFKPLTARISRVPGPWYSRWTGAALKYQWLRGQRPAYVHRLHEKYGPVVRIAPNEVDVTDMEAIKAIYDSKETFKKTSFYRELTAVRSPVLFTFTDVAMHRRLRRLMSTPLSASSLKLHHKLVQSKVNLYIRRIREEMVTRGAVDVFKWNLFLATDVVAELSFGESFRTLEKDEASLLLRSSYVDLIENIGPLGAIRSAFPRLASFAFVLPIPVLKSAATASRDVKRYGAESLRRMYKLAAASDADDAPSPSSDNHHHDTLFTKLRESEQKGDITYEEICANASGYIMAGSDTTASTLTYLIWSVCRRPAIRDALVRQLQQAVALQKQRTPSDGDGDGEDDKNSLDDDSLRAIPLLDHVIDETLRLYGATASGLPRETPPAGADLAGYRFDAGTVLCAQAYSVHRDAAVFPDPERFEPRRWEKPSKAMLDNFMPFGRGPRVCIGLHLARMEIRMAVANFFLAFPLATLSSREGFSDRDMKRKMFFVANPTGRRCLVEV